MFLKREGKEDCIIAGYAIAEGKECEWDSKSIYKIAVNIGKDLPLINVALWERAIEIKKGDRVFACGKLTVNTKEDKTYYSLSADYVSVEKSEKRQAIPTELTETDNDDLPF